MESDDVWICQKTNLVMACFFPSVHKYKDIISSDSQDDKHRQDVEYSNVAEIQYHPEREIS